MSISNTDAKALLAACDADYSRMYCNVAFSDRQGTRHEDKYISIPRSNRNQIAGSPDLLSGVSCWVRSLLSAVIDPLGRRITDWRKAKTTRSPQSSLDAMLCYSIADLWTSSDSRRDAKCPPRTTSGKTECHSSGVDLPRPDPVAVGQIYSSESALWLRRAPPCHLGFCYSWTRIAVLEEVFRIDCAAFRDQTVTATHRNSGHHLSND